MKIDELKKAADENPDLENKLRETEKDRDTAVETFRVLYRSRLTNFISDAFRDFRSFFGPRGFDCSVDNGYPTACYKSAKITMIIPELPESSSPGEFLFSIESAEPKQKHRKSHSIRLEPDFVVPHYDKSRERHKDIQKEIDAQVRILEQFQSITDNDITFTFSINTGPKENINDSSFLNVLQKLDEAGSF